MATTTVCRCCWALTLTLTPTLTLTLTLTLGAAALTFAAAALAAAAAALPRHLPGYTLYDYSMRPVCTTCGNPTSGCFTTEAAARTHTVALATVSIGV
jgi:hypothetical protein